MSKKINKKLQKSSWILLAIVLVFSISLGTAMGYLIFHSATAEDTPRFLSEMDSNSTEFNYYSDRDPSPVSPTRIPPSNITKSNLVDHEIPQENCTNGRDDDGNGLVDCADVKCAFHIDCQPVENCTDGIDNDGDGSLDCNDTDCKSHAACKNPKLAPAWKTPKLKTPPTQPKTK